MASAHAATNGSAMGHGSFYMAHNHMDTQRSWRRTHTFTTPGTSFPMYVHATFSPTAKSFSPMVAAADAQSWNEGCQGCSHATSRLSDQQ